MSPHLKLKALFLFLTMYLGACVHVEPPAPGKQRGELLYQVKRGDTLSSLADSFGVHWKAIAYRNRIRNPRDLQVGEIIIIPSNRRPIKRQPPAVDGGGLLFGGSSRFLWPVPNGSLSSKFGMRRGRPHHGIDIRAPRGTPVKAAKPGRVSFVGWKRGYGKTIIVDHDNYQTLYAHLSRIKVSHRQWVSKGQLLGLVGSTGRSSGSHLHYEIRRDDKPLNPLSFYRPGA
ncbi:LysM peptidoglycan-binding domain-containing M23 family metallopeptidase [Pseudobacteriovorax antillogorgiicola]|uniref:LysM domain-containing protein n=1 Tax=Pseudobacteriovorax antillogorgiicola TaxID=1513793 RepID=A0A1Y6CG22_9BACT|nr:LysM peptidoglycan-binding domain-containing M23 family metallopeptidase [Pseudobacteriovorax antillogorgiicola]TCS47284.1 LysM domain-containing protein [Pseudobacteriovorax antillogorgiicola]SMF62324.1 LysM domain-containing protein [Pseudobacteriovorax antillogorgiicola]